jgi:hypothetical protein
MQSSFSNFDSKFISKYFDLKAEIVLNILDFFHNNLFYNFQ